MKVNLDKCKQCGNGRDQKITFLGQNFDPKAISLAPEIKKRLEKIENIIFNFDIPKHTRLLIFKQCIQTLANYGPLLDVVTSGEEYKEVDIVLAKILKRILELDD